MRKKFPCHKRKRFPNYLLPKIVKALKGIAFIVVIFMIATIADSIGQSFNPKISVDAYHSQSRISPNLYGYSTSSEFTYDATLIDAVKKSGIESFRLTAPYNPGNRMLIKTEDGATTVLKSDNIPYEFNREYLLEIVVSGSRYQVYIDHQEIFDVSDNSFTSGEIALFSSYNQDVSFDDYVIRDQYENVLFTDNFDNGLSNQWNTKDVPTWYDQGTWKVENGALKHIGQQSLALKQIGNKEWQNYIISTKITPKSASRYEQGYIGVMFRFQNSLNGYRFLWDGELPHPYSSNNPWDVSDFEGQIRTAKELGVTPNVIVNFRGTKEEAAALVYELNVENKLGVVYFELGNEIWNYGDSHMTSQMYAKKIKEFSEAMKAVDPKIKVGASLLIGFSNWDIPVIEEAAPEIDFIVLHHYLAASDGLHPSNRQMMAASYSFGNRYLSSYGDGTIGFIDQAKEVVKKYAPKEAERLEYVLTEYNTFDEEKGKNLAFGLATAEILAESGKKQVKIAEFHQLSNSERHWSAYTNDYRQRPAALATSLFTNHFGEISLPVSLKDVPTYEVEETGSMPEMKDAPYLSVFASRNSADKKLYLAVINKHGVAEMNTKIEINNAEVKPFAFTYTLDGASENSTNELKNNITVEKSSIDFAAKSLSYTFKPHSVTIIEFDINLIKPTSGVTTVKKPEPKTNTNISIIDKIIKPKTIDIGGPTENALGLTTIISSTLGGGNPRVKSFDEKGLPTGHDFLSFNHSFRGGVSVAYADVNGDGKDDIITGAGPGGGPHVRVFDHLGKEIMNFFPFHENFRGGVKVAAGDVDHDGKAEIAVSQASQGQAWVKVYKVNAEKTIVTSFNAYGQVECGGDVALGDIDQDEAAEIIVGAGKGGGPLVRVFETDGRVKPIQFFAFHENYRDGISVAAGDVDGDLKDEIVISQSGPQQAWVKVYRYNNQHTIIGEWKAYGDFEVGANVATADLDHDGKAEIITGAGEGGGPQILGFKANGMPTGLNFFVFDQAFRGGIDVAGKRINK